MAKAKPKDVKRRKVRQKRVHLFRNPYVCDQCFKWWREADVKGNEKKLFLQVKDGPMRHRGCSGAVLSYASLSRKDILQLVTERNLLSDPSHRDFYPSMGNLIREDMPDTSHHNPLCTGACCATDTNGSLGPEPTAAAKVGVVVGYSTLSGWEEQAAKTCAAASVAGALNGALGNFGEREQPQLKRTRSDEGAMPRDKKLKENSEAGDSRRIFEQDIIDYYCKWAREAGRINCHAALRGSCGLTPSTRKIGNPRLIRACHAVGASFVASQVERLHRAADDNNRYNRHPYVAGRSAPVSLPTIPAHAANAGSDDDDDDDGDDDWSPVDDEDFSPIETARLLGNWMTRDRVDEGGHCAPDDGKEVEDAQWAKIKRALAEGSSLLLHFRNHYSLIFAAREWRCEATGTERRQLLTATQKQRPHVWFCFRQLRADIVYSKVNLLLLIRRSPLLPSALPSSSGSSVSTCSSASAASSRSSDSLCDAVRACEDLCHERRQV